MRSIRYDHEPGNVPAELAAIPFFGRLRPACLDEVLDSASVLEADPGEAIVTEGDRTHALYFLVRGTLRIEKGGRKVADLGNPGELFGEIAFVNDQPHGSTVRASTGATVFKLDRAVTRALSDSEIEHFDSVLYRFLTELLAARLDKTSGRIAQPFGSPSDEPDVYRL